MKSLNTDNTTIKLVPPEIARDAKLGVLWVNGVGGKETMILMGNKPDNVAPTTLKNEQRRVRSFIESKNQLNWMIQLNDKIVGTVWVNLDPTKYLASPSIHIMIGEPSCRRQGVGTSACKTVIDFLKNTGQYEKIYSRHLIKNVGSAKMLTTLGFIKNGQPYRDTDDLEFQNVQLNLAE